MFSVVLIPDTHVNAITPKADLVAMGQWIVDNANALNVRAVIHLGDVGTNGVESEFLDTKDALAPIDNAGIPMLICMGNHDYDGGAPNGRTNDSLFNQHFGISRYNGKSWFGGAYESGKSNNVFARIEGDGEELLLFALEFGPRQGVLDWVDDIVKRNRSSHVLIATHSYVTAGGIRTGYGAAYNPKGYSLGSDVNDGTDMWRKLIRRLPNIRAVYSGHHIPENFSYRIDLGRWGNPVYQAMYNWQSLAGGGGRGRVVVAQLDFQRNAVELNVYNPSSGQWEHQYDVRHPILA